MDHLQRSVGRPGESFVDPSSQHVQLIGRKGILTPLGHLELSLVRGGQVQQTLFRTTRNHSGSPRASLQKGVALAHIQPRGFGFPVARAAVLLQDRYRLFRKGPVSCGQESGGWHTQDYNDHQERCARARETSMATTGELRRRTITNSRHLKYRNDDHLRRSFRARRIALKEFRGPVHHFRLTE